MSGPTGILIRRTRASDYLVWLFGALDGRGILKNSMGDALIDQVKAPKRPAPKAEAAEAPKRKPDPDPRWRELLGALRSLAGPAPKGDRKARNAAKRRRQGRA